MREARKFDPANWQRLVSSERRALLDPGGFVDRIAIRAGEAVADLGAGPGFFTGELSERVGPGGRVWAVDVAPDMVRLLRERDLPPWVDVRLAGENRLPIPDTTVDTALLAFVLHELEDPQAFLAEVVRILRPSGRLVMLEWVPRDEPLGPPIHERIAEAEAAGMLEAAGFRIAERAMANASNYYLVARVDAD